MTWDDHTELEKRQKAEALVSALTTENERLREEKRLNDTDLANWHAAEARLASEREAYAMASARADRAEDRLATAVGLLSRVDAPTREWNACYRALLASAQPAAPARAHDREDCDNPECGTCMFNQPAVPTRTPGKFGYVHDLGDEHAAPARTEAEQAVLDAMAEVDEDWLRDPPALAYEAPFAAELARRGLK